MKIRRPSAVGRALLGALLVSATAWAADPADLKTRAKKPPKEPTEVHELGRALRRAGLFDDAVRVLRSGYPRAKGEVGVAIRLEAARSLIAAAKQKEAVRECQGLKALSAPKADACTAEAHLLWRRASLALPLADKALAAAPADYDALVAKGRALGQMGKSQEAQAALEDAIAGDATRFEAHAELGQLFGTLGRQSAAIAALKKAHAASPEEPGPLLSLGEVLPVGTEAADALKKALAIRPKYGAAHARLGDVLLEQGALAEAEQSLKTALGIDSKQADWHAGLARVLVAKGSFDEALKSTAAALKIVGNHAGAKLAEADALAGRGDIDLAIEAYEKASSHARTSPTPLVHAARASLAQNRPTTARAFADRVTQTFPEWGPGWVALGDVAAAVKEKATAKSAYQKALGAQGPVDKASVKKKLAALK